VNSVRGSSARIAAAAAAVIVGASLLVPLPASAAVAAQPASPATSGSLQHDIRVLLKELPGSYTVSVRELDGEQRTASVRGHANREPASSAKLFIAYGVFRRIDLGLLDLSSHTSSGQTVKQCLRAMIQPSDNYCAIELRQKVGTKWLDSLMRKNGFGDTHFWYSGGRTKVTSSSDMVTLLSRLERGELVSEKSTNRFTELLKSQVWRDALAPGLPEGIALAAKPGTLSTGSGLVETDAGIVYGPTSRYVIGVMGNRGATRHSITRISRLVYRELQERGGKLFQYSSKQMKTTAKVALRSAPGKNAPIVKWLPKGTLVQVTDARRRWYHVWADGRRGWAFNAGLTLRHPYN
jgi:beta-lactamase class A